MSWREATITGLERLRDRPRHAHPKMVEVPLAAIERLWCLWGSPTPEQCEAGGVPCPQCALKLLAKEIEK